MLFLVVAGLLFYWDQIIKGVATTGTAPEPTEVVPEAPTTAEETTGPPQEEENGVRVVVSVVGARAVGLTILEEFWKMDNSFTTR
jgi:hypothetical protein